MSKKSEKTTQSISTRTKVSRPSISRRQMDESGSSSQAKVSQPSISRRQMDENGSSSQAKVSRPSISRRQMDESGSSSQAKVSQPSISRRQMDENGSSSQAKVSRPSISRRQMDESGSFSQAKKSGIERDFKRKKKPRKRADKEREKKVLGYKSNIEFPKRDGPLKWHSKEEIKRKFELFYNEKSKPPSEKEIRDARIGKLIKELKDFIAAYEKKGAKNSWLNRVEHTGSIYEGLKINDGLEFDLMFVMNGRKQFNVRDVNEQPGYAYLIQNKDNRRRSLLNKLLVESEKTLTISKKGKEKRTNTTTTKTTQTKAAEEAAKKDDKDLFLSPELVISKFQSVVQKFLDSLEKYPEKKEELKLANCSMKLIRHGPAIQLDVSDDEKKLYSVDLVPSYEVDSEKEGPVLYVAKPPKTDVKEHVNAWRKSFSLEEKIKIRVAENNDCRKQVVRFLKGLCKEEDNLNTVTSYHWKTLLFHVVDHEDKLKWKESDVHSRTFQLLEYMAKFVKMRKFPQYFLTKMNLFEDLDEKRAIQISNRLTALYTTEEKFLKALDKSVEENADDETRDCKTEAEKPVQSSSVENGTPMEACE